MKKLLLFLGAFVLFLASCTKENSDHSTYLEITCDSIAKHENHRDVYLSVKNTGDKSFFLNFITIEGYNNCISQTRKFPIKKNIFPFEIKKGEITWMGVYMDTIKIMGYE
jgi:CRISPR/Cas system CMR-associated protein Cmr5 small subunit